MDASVIITAYNNAPTLAEALDALGSDRELEFEVIVADDGSSDGTSEVITRARQKHPMRLLYVWQPDEGFRAARIRNLALRHATGRIIVFFDGDVVPSAKCVRQHIAAHQGNNRHIVVGSRRWYGPLADRDFVQATRGMPPGSVVAQLPCPTDTRRRERRERNFRQAAVESEHPWRAFYTGHASLTNDEAVLFDERYVGWGGEDWEVALRLVSRQGWSLVYREDIEASHVDLHGRYWNPMRRTTSPNGIDQFLRNVCRLAATWPEALEAGVLGVFGRFYYSDGKWLIRKGPTRSDVRTLPDEVIINMVKQSALGETPEGIELLRALAGRVEK